MSTFTKDGVTIRFRITNVAADRNHCYVPTCADEGEPLVDKLARWESAGEVTRAPADATVQTCARHTAGFEAAKELFMETQESASAAYLTREDIDNYMQRRRM